MNWVFHFDLDKLRNKAKDLEIKTYEADFWDDSQSAQKIMQKFKGLNKKIKEYDDLYNEISELELLLELIIEEESYDEYKEIKGDIETVSQKSEDFKLSTLLNGQYDKNNAILSIHSGAGGLEAQDWAEMLLRMYRRWALGKEYEVETLDLLADTEGGIKSVTLLIQGFNAYGYLKSEKGVHRLVRMSPFDSSGKRHTSFASIDVFPEIDDDNDIEINDNETKVDTFRSSGSGGQHVNTTDSAIRITHIPTGIVVQCQSERSQHMNRQTALNMLKSKLIQVKEEENKEKIDDLQGKYTQIAWGSQIRSYIFHPYSMVKDHRTDTETGNASKVMDGDIDVFINEFLKYKSLN